MTAVRPREVVHRGRQLAAAVSLDARLLGEEGARRRALALWEPGVRVLAIDGGLLVRFPHPRPLAAEEAPGLVAVEEGGVLVAAPLSRAERDQLAPPAGALVVARAGVAVALAPGPELDPSRWLGLEPRLVPVEPLGLPPEPPPPPPPPPAPDVRTALKVPPAAARAAEAGAALRLALAGRASPEGGAGKRARAWGVVAGAAGAVGGAVGWLGGKVLEELGMIADMLATPVGAGRGSAPVRGVVRPPPEPGPVRRWLNRRMEHLLLATRIARLAGIWQGAWALRLARMFERGDLAEALRHAIPLGGGEPDPAPALGLPGTRASLRIDPAGRASSALVGLGPGIDVALRQLYRRAFQQLEAQGRFEEAAFVLAELLRADAEAVSFLERHGQLRLAAELAEGRGLPPGLVVRQWFLAGEREHAIRVARARRAFADAVDRLERSQRREEAAALRLLWAEDLAEAGDLEGAVFAARPVPAARPLVARWIELAVASGSDAGRALLAVRLELEPERFAEVRDRVLADCGDDTEDGTGHRAALARGLARAQGARGAAVLARALLRAALRDRAAGRWPAADPAKALGPLARDAALDADLPRPGALLARAPAVVKLALRPDDRGARPVHDAAVLPGGRVLVALGEAGAALLSRDGREVARLDAPAHRLVVSDSGTRALALGARGETTRVSHLDLDARRARPLRDLGVQPGGFARSYDGARWWVAQGRSVALLDALRDDLRVLWHVTDLPGWPFALEQDGGTVAFVTASATDGEPLQVEGWTYDDQVLRRRVELVPLSDGARLELAGHAARRWYGVELGGPERDPVLRSVEVGARGGLPLPGVEEVISLAGGAWLGAAIRTAAGAEVLVVDPANLQPRAVVTLPGASNASLRLAGDRLTVADDCGRVVGVELGSGRVTHDLRT